jgi:hypothetical protein
MKQKTECHQRQQGFCLLARLVGFRYAFNGLLTMVVEQTAFSGRDGRGGLERQRA